jgi:endonuclease/exonuclease/phosphatase family metal-dependent hydrolase
VVARADTQVEQIAPSDVAFVSWNVHVGNGDLRRLVADLRAGRITGHPVRHFVLMIQEAVRTSGVPPLAPDASGARAIEARVEASADIVQIARELDLWLVYVPSMRNGNSLAAPAADRGNAILSTLPLEDPTAIELPGERQRRVVILAHLDLGTGQPLTVGTVHFDALGDSRRLWVFGTTSVRKTQAKSLGSKLPSGPMVLGADLNTWHGAHEPAVEYLSRLFDESAMVEKPGDFRLRALDYLFFRLGDGLRTGYEVVENAYGSDHKPLVGWAAQPASASR